MLSIQKLYLVYTANAIMSKCERSRKMLEISFIQIQTNVLPLLFKKISNLVEDIKSATFTLDSSEKEAGKFVHQLVHGCASESSADENFKLNVLQSALMRLHITSPKAILIEKISIKKLIKEIDDIDPKKKKILKYFLYLLKQHGNQIVAEKSEVIAEIKIEDVSSLDQSYQSSNSLDSSVNLSHASLGSLDLSLNSDLSVSKYTSSLTTSSILTNESSWK